MTETYSPHAADAEIAELLRRHQEADAAYDRALDDDSVPKAEMLRAAAEYGRTWRDYTEACVAAGVCVRPGCGQSVSVANRRLCQEHRADRTKVKR